MSSTTTTPLTQNEENAKLEKANAPLPTGVPKTTPWFVWIVVFLSLVLIIIIILIFLALRDPSFQDCKKPKCMYCTKKNNQYGQDISQLTDEEQIKMMSSKTKKKNKHILPKSIKHEKSEKGEIPVISQDHKPPIITDAHICTEEKETKINVIGQNFNSEISIELMFSDGSNDYIKTKSIHSHLINFTVNNKEKINKIKALRVTNIDSQSATFYLAVGTKDHIYLSFAPIGKSGINGEQDISVILYKNGTPYNPNMKGTLILKQQTLQNDIEIVAREWHLPLNNIVTTFKNAYQPDHMRIPTFFTVEAKDIMVENGQTMLLDKIESNVFLH